ncbi:DUF2927 domain-containing protein [Falsirhodobacter sp. alg1]|uniref:DUF2927 domain-containing protein n=1 Tax=Falsirhodobacter sp. alg1 TaxID=1472418 RepID=UPI0006935E90|nr:DUF2927 domain-containing protein [Falsirhodobacter sp. alg1]
MALRGPYIIGLVLLALAGCAAKVVEEPEAVPVRPKSRPAAIAAPVAPSARSMAISQYYAGIQSDLLSRGLLRTDGGGADTPFDDRVLADNFIRIALYDEYVRDDQGFRQVETPGRLRRWTKPVRVGLVFGPSLSAQARAIERARVGSYLARLSRLTGHQIGLAPDHTNFNIFIVNEDERLGLGTAIQKAAPNLSASEVASVENLPRDTYCLVYASSNAASTYTGAFALIREEHPTLLSMACLHEEIAQGLGLQNDSPQARPSIFNDDDEFALLTGMDELMLRILYDPRLSPGMTEAEARPIVQTIATELMASAS